MLIPEGVTEFEQVIKKSRFIAYLAHAASPQAAHAYIDSIRAQYPDARHVCWAFIAGEPGNTPFVSCSDDGEPSGTAGKPMLNVLQHGGVGEIVAVVVRYFGGVKLGTGGLVRAYSGSVTEAMKVISTLERVPVQLLQLTVPYPLEDAVRRALASHDASIKSSDYGEALVLSVACPQTAVEVLQLVLGDVGRGEINIRK